MFILLCLCHPTVSTLDKGVTFLGHPSGSSFGLLDRSCYQDISWTAWAVDETYRECLLAPTDDLPTWSTKPSTLRGMEKWVPARRQWCSAAGTVIACLAESNGNLLPGGWLKSPAGWLPLHWDQLRAQCSVTSMGSLYLLLITKGQGHSRLLTWRRLPCRC